jgi:pilus assembly protein Flp/PilA
MSIRPMVMRGHYHARTIHLGGQMKALFVKMLKDESSATAIEYGLIAAGISVAIISVVQGLGSKLKSTFNSVQNALN